MQFADYKSINLVPISINDLKKQINIHLMKESNFIEASWFPKCYCGTVPFFLFQSLLQFFWKSKKYQP